MGENTYSLFDVDKIDSLESLKNWGSFLALKNHIEKKIGCKLAVRSWQGLYQNIKSVSLIVNSKKSLIDDVLAIESLPSAKSELKRILDLKVSAKSKSELVDKIALITAFFIKSEFSAYERYEKNKRRNFINSSRLEGLSIKVNADKKTLEQILSEHRQTVDG